MNTYRILLALFFPLLAALLGCNEEKLIGPGVDKDSAPGPVSDVQVENLPGGARISYSLPPDENLLYVKAAYAIREGKTMEVKSSFHKNFLEVEGFPDTRPYEVKLYAVSRGEKPSEPVIVNVNPLQPPVQEAFESLELKRTFGGISVNYRNSGEADLALVVLAADSLGELRQATTYYTKMKEGIFAARGFDTLERQFGVYVRDRWDNYSDTVFVRVKPFYEKELNKDLFREVHLAGDYAQPHNQGRSRMSNLWDRDTSPTAVTALFATVPGGGFPQSFTFDMGVTASLSRLVYYPRANGSFAYTNQPRLFEIWGSNNPDSTGTWDSWTKLMDCEMIKPSGFPQGEVTEDDRAYAMAGIEYELPVGTPPVRYIRFKTLEVWSGSNISIVELTLFGNDEQ